MKFRIHVFALTLGLGLAIPAVAQEDPAKTAPAKEEPAKAEPGAAPAAEAEKPAADAAAAPAPAAAPDAAEAAKPAAAAAAAPPAEPVKPTAEAAKPAAEAAKPAAPPAAKELTACAKSFQPLADSYKKAYDDMQNWIAQIDAQTSAANDNVVKLQTQIKDNDAASVKAKAAGDNAKVKEIDKQNKQLKSQLTAANKTLASACSGFGKEASDHTKQNEAAIDKALADVKAATK